MPKIVQDVGERPLVLHSDVTGSIADLSFLQRSLLFAEFSMIAYNDEKEARRAAAAIGFPETTFFENDGAQAFRFRNEHDCVITCRGTEPDDWNDIQAGVDAIAVLAETAGKVHRGFKREVDDLWPMLEEILTPNRQPLWFCGHSLGGAMATICAGRCILSHIPSDPKELYTFGSPRVGDKRYVNYVRLNYYRWVNNNDIVTRVPPPWLGYRHAGQEIYLNRNGRIRKLTGWGRTSDRWHGTLRGLLGWKVDALADHKIHSYIDAILSEVEVENKSVAAGRGTVQVNDVALPPAEIPPLEAPSASLDARQGTT